MAKIVATPAPEFRTNTIRAVAWCYAGILTVMVLGQLFAFEKFIPLMQDYKLQGGYGAAVFISCVVVIMEIFALPFLLRMSLSPLMRTVGMFFTVLVPALWLSLVVHAYTSHNIPLNGGILGTKLTISVPVQALFSVILLVMALYIVYGVGQKHKK